MIDFFKSNYDKFCFCILFLLEVVICGLLVFCLLKCDDKESFNDIQMQTQVDAVEVIPEAASNVRVDIKGAVVKPGVYEISDDSRIGDVITLAGGLKSSASTKYLNLSKKVSDEMVINIYTSAQIKSMENSAEVKDVCKCETIYINECAGSNIIESGTTNDNSSDLKEGFDLISINTASLEELMMLSGVGEAKASAIIEYRNKYGSFKDISEIKNVSGISDSLYEKIRNYITV